MSEPRERAHHEPHLAEGDVHERAHEARVELGLGTARDLGSGFGRAGGLLVRARRRDHVEDVGDRDDASGQWDLFARDPPRVALAVPAFVVVADRFGPLPQPFAERLDQALAVQRMAAQLLPFLVGRLAGLVENLGADLELPDVVEERGPVQTVQVVVRQAELLAEAVGVGANALGVSSRDLVVDIERGGKPEQDLGGLLGGERLAHLSHEDQPLLEALDRARAQGQLEPGRRLVRKDQRELEQRPERQEPTGNRVDHRDDRRCEDADRRTTTAGTRRAIRLAHL